MLDVPNKHLSRVVLPAPDGPMMAVSEFEPIAPLIPFKIRRGSRSTALAACGQPVRAFGSYTLKFFHTRATPGFAELLDREERVAVEVTEAMEAVDSVGDECECDSDGES